MLVAVAWVATLKLPFFDAPLEGELAGLFLKGDLARLALAFKAPLKGEGEERDDRRLVRIFF